jgi:integrating conjugative element relaxase (TIGR03760 family)
VHYELAALASVMAAALLVLWWLMREPPGAQATGESNGGASPLSKAPMWAPADTLPVVDSQRLLSRSEVAQLVSSIISKSGFSAGNVERDLIPMIQGYAEFVQMLPASEAHHHAQPGGMLQHTLEVLDFALSYRRSYMLPLGAGAERVNELKHVWTMAVILVAMFHDIGKPMSDLVVTMYAHHGVPREGRRWTPLAGPMASQGATHYRVDFNRERRYEHHAELSVIVMQRLVPAHVLSWIGEQDAELLPLVLASLGSTVPTVSILVDIVRRADQESTRVNLLNGPRTRFRSARETPLVDVLDGALNRLIDSGRLRFNVPGGHGFVDGDDLLIVVPRVVDEIRSYLSTALIAGSRGIPQDNLILYSTWMDFGRLIPQPGLARSDGTQGPPRAVWRVKIEGIPSVLAVLRIPRTSPSVQALAKQWPPVYPEAITVIQSADDEVLMAAAPTAPSMAQASSAVSADAAAQSDSLVPDSGMAAHAVAEHRPVQGGMPQPPGATAPVAMPDFLLEMPDDSLAPLQQPKTAPGAPMISAAYLEQERQAVQRLQDADGLVVPNPLEALLSRPTGVIPTTARTAVRPSAVPTMKIKTPQSSASKSALLEDFEDWLRLGIQSGHIAYNSAQAMIHFHQLEIDGAASTVALFVTPALYQRFAKERDAKLADTPLIDIPKTAWLPVQTALLKAHAHRKESAGKISKTIFRFATKSGGMFGANVMTEPQKIFGVVPEANPFISGEVKDTALAALKKT